MSGLLHRLAARAMSRAAPPRADGLPLYVAPAPPDGYAAVAAPSLEPSAARQVAGAKAPDPVMPPSLPTLSTLPLDPTSRASTRAGSPVLADPAGETPAAAQRLPEPAPGNPAISMTPPEVRPHAPEGRRVVPRVYEGRVAAIRRAAPAPLLMPPEPVLASGPVSRLAPSAAVGPVRLTAESDTEVHVTIGRIEITAVHEAPAARPRPKPADRLVSLDQYLARREDGRP